MIVNHSYFNPWVVLYEWKLIHVQNLIDSWSLYIWSFFSLSCTTEFFKMNGPVPFSSFDLTVSYFIIGSRLESNTIWNIEPKWPRQTTTLTFPVPKIDCSRTVNQFGGTKGSYLGLQTLFEVSNLIFLTILFCEYSWFGIRIKSPTFGV